MTKLEAFDAACTHAREDIQKGGEPAVDVLADTVMVYCSIEKDRTFDYKEDNDED